MTEPTRVHIEIENGWEGVIDLKIRVDRNGVATVEQPEPPPPNSPAPEGEETGA